MHRHVPQNLDLPRRGPHTRKACRCNNCVVQSLVAMTLGLLSLLHAKEERPPPVWRIRLVRPSCTCQSTKYSPSPAAWTCQSPPAHPCCQEPTVAVFAGDFAATIGSLHVPKSRSCSRFAQRTSNCPVVTNLQPTPLPMDDGEAKSAHCSSSSTWNTMPSSVTWCLHPNRPRQHVFLERPPAATEPSFHSQRQDHRERSRSKGPLETRPRRAEAS